MYICYGCIHACVFMMYSEEEKVFLYAHPSILFLFRYLAVIVQWLGLYFDFDIFSREKKMYIFLELDLSTSLTKLCQKKKFELCKLIRNKKILLVSLLRKSILPFLYHTWHWHSKKKKLRIQDFQVLCAYTTIYYLMMNIYVSLFSLKLFLKYIMGT